MAVLILVLQCILFCPPKAGTIWDLGEKKGKTKRDESSICSRSHLMPLMCPDEFVCLKEISGEKMCWFCVWTLGQDHLY